MDVSGWTTEFMLRPAWALHRAGTAIARRRDRRAHETHAEQLALLQLPIDNAIAAVLRVDVKNVKEILGTYAGTELKRTDSDIPRGWKASDNFCLLLFCVCRLMKPQLVLETGVATGVSSATILHALSANQKGQLHSVEFPPLGRRDLSYIGSSIPDEVKDRWTLYTGPSTSLLREFVRRQQSIDIFVHDSDHSYWNQIAEYTMAWQLLRPGGLLISDDARSDSLLDFASKSGARPVTITRSDRGGFIALIWKPDEKAK